MWNFSRALDVYVFMLDILTVMDNHTTWPDYFRSDILDNISVLLEKFSYKNCIHMSVVTQ